MHADKDHAAILFEAQFNSLIQCNPERVVLLARTEQAVGDDRDAIAFRDHNRIDAGRFSGLLQRRLLACPVADPKPLVDCPGDRRLIRHPDSTSNENQYYRKLCQPSVHRLLLITAVAGCVVW
jgi:hypothetical protein